MSTVQLLVTITSPDDMLPSEGLTLLDFALSCANIEAEAIIEDGGNCSDPELLALAHRWKSLIVNASPIALLNTPSGPGVLMTAVSQSPDFLPTEEFRRVGASPNFAAPYGEYADVPQGTATFTSKNEN